jgi:hypothetical protein
MANKIILKKSSVAAKVPLSTDLEVGEIAVNLVDQKLYSKKADGTVVLVGTGISGGTGNVTGAASSTDNAVTRFDGTTGKVIQNSAVIIDDSNNVSGVATLNAATLIIADNVTLGSSNTDTVAVNGRITTDVEPNANNAKDIGTSGRNWRDGFFGRTLHTVNLDLTGTTSFDGSQGTSGQVLTSAGTGNTPTWTTPAAGTVTAVTGTAPVVSSGGTTPAISMAAATTAVNGYLTSTDWNTFNNKTSNTGTVTSVASGNGMNFTTITGSGTVTMGTPSTLTTSTTNATTTTSHTHAITTASANTASTIVSRDASGNFSAGTITAALSGNATTATTATTATSATTATNATNVTVTTSATASAFKVPFANTTASTTGNYGLLQDSEATFTYNPSTNTLTVGTVAAALSGNATTATALATARNINGTSFNGSADITTANWGTARTLWGQSVNGSANITDPLLPAAGTAALPAFSTSGDTNTGIFFPAADTIAFSKGGVEAMRIDSSGNVGIGTNTPGAALHVAGAIQAGPTGSGVLSGLFNNIYGIVKLHGSTGGILDFSTSGSAFKGRIIYDNATNFMSFSTNGAEAMRVTSAGGVVVGTTAALSGAKFSVNGAIASTGYKARAGDNGAFSGNVFNINWTGSAAQLWIDATNIGAFVFSSDYRIKRNIQTQTRPALERVMQLRPVTYQMANYGTLFKQNEEIKEGFIAHEVQAVIPSGVDGAKDDETKIQSLRLDAMLAVAIKAIQELKTEFDAYKASHP